MVAEEGIIRDNVSALVQPEHDGPEQRLLDGLGHQVAGADAARGLIDGHHCQA